MKQIITTTNRWLLATIMLNAAILLLLSQLTALSETLDLVHLACAAFVLSSTLPISQIYSPPRLPNTEIALVFALLINPPWLVIVLFAVLLTLQALAEKYFNAEEDPLNNAPFQSIGFAAAALVYSLLMAPQDQQAMTDLALFALLTLTAVTFIITFRVTRMIAREGLNKAVLAQVQWLHVIDSLYAGFIGLVLYRLLAAPLLDLPGALNVVLLAPPLIYAFGQLNVEAIRATRQMRKAGRIEVQNRSLIDTLPVGIYRSTPDGTILDVNPAVAKMLKYDHPDDLIQTNAFTHYFNPEIRQRIIEDQRHDPGYSVNEYRLKRSDGEAVWVRDISRPVFDSLGNLRFIEGVMEDITVYKAFETALNETHDLIRRAKQEWETTVDSLPQFVCLLDKNQTILRANHVFERWRMGKVTQIPGRSLSQLVMAHLHVEDFKQRLDEAWERLAEGGSYSVELTDTLSGKELLMQVNPAITMAFRTESSGNVYAAVVISDISTQKQLENDLKKLNTELDARVKERTLQLEAANKRLQKEIQERAQLAQELQKALDHEKELNAFKARFGSMISHEFRTPLSVIQTSTDIIQKYGKKISEDQMRDIPNRISTEVRHLVNLLEDILTISQADTIGLELLPERMEIGSFVRRVSEEMRSYVEKSHTLVVNDHSNGTILYADEKRMRQVLTNLLSNAMKYSEAGTMVTVEILAEDDEVCLRVRDQGIGIPKEAQPHLFDMFYRAGNVGTISGTGLGLAIVKLITELHHGRVHLESDINMGTTFELYFPMRIAV